MNITSHVVSDPESGQSVSLPAGSRLDVKFARRGLGLSQWRIAERPGYLLPIAEAGHDFSFLVFGDSGAASGAATVLRMERFRPDRPGIFEERTLLVMPA